MDLKDAVNKLCYELKRDKKLFDTYQANISMSIFDEAKKMKIKIPHSQLVELCNGGATRFLNLFIEK